MFQVNIINLVPSLLNFLLAHPKFTRENFDHVDCMISGAAPVPESSAAAVYDRISKNGQMIQGENWSKIIGF